MHLVNANTGMKIGEFAATETETEEASRQRWDVANRNETGKEI